jgi:hypothetical protein
MDAKILFHAGLYLVGFVIGELALFAAWGLKQPAGTPARRYVFEQWPSALLSACVAGAACLLWSEGSLAAHLPDALPFTGGMSIVAGAALTFFAHGVVRLVGRRSGLGDEP